MAENRNICAKNLPKDIDVVSFFDIDDYMHPRRLEFVEKAFTEGGADVFIHGYEYIKYEQKPDEYWEKMSKEVEVVYNSVEQDELIGAVGHLSVLKSLFDSFNFLETNDLKFSSDIEYIKDSQKRGLKLMQCSAKLSLYLYRCPRVLSSTKLYCWWTGNNEMSGNRKKCLASLTNTNLEVVFITQSNLNEYLVEPLHEGFRYLSDMHKGDYLKAYFMHFYGGAYTDIKFVQHDWSKYAKEMYENEDVWIMGYRENDEGGVAFNPDDKIYENSRRNWRKLIGNGAYICKPKTQLTQEWYDLMIKLLDDNLEKLKKNPAKHHMDHNSPESEYPFRWAQVNGEIFHPLILKHNAHVSQDLPKYLEHVSYR